MITILTETPDELVKSLKSYFLIDNCYVIVAIPDDVEDNLEAWLDIYDGRVLYNDKITFKLPFLVITEDKDLYERLLCTFNTKTLIEITDIMTDGALFIESGFLPIDHELIEHYMTTKYINTATASPTAEELIICMFRDLGYLSPERSPTGRLILSLYYADKSTEKYARQLSCLIINYEPEEIAAKPGYIASIIEMLKFIDIHVHIVAYKLANGDSVNTNESSDEVEIIINDN